MHPLINTIKKSQTILLSTHTQPDGDGLGSQLALYSALKKIGKDVRIVNVDYTPKKYHFLDNHEKVELFNILKNPIQQTDLCLIFDTNDPNLLQELWPELQKKCERVSFIDHHPVLQRHPLDLEENLINVDASSTGEMTFDLIKDLGIELDKDICLPLYTSIVFDTHYFRYIRGSARPHLIAAELLNHDIKPQVVHQNLFGNHSQNKLRYLSKVLGGVEYLLDGRLACVHIDKAEVLKLGLEMEETRDIIDMIMNVQTIEAATLIREEGHGSFKLSFRSKGHYEVNGLAESLGGGGHRFAAGAFLKENLETIKKKVTEGFTEIFSRPPLK